MHDIDKNRFTDELSLKGACDENLTILIFFVLGVIFAVDYGYSDAFSPQKMPFVYFSVNYIVTHPLNLRADAKAS